MREPMNSQQEETYMYRFTFTAVLIISTESFENFTASIVAKDRNEAVKKVIEALGDDWEIEFDTLLKVEEV